MSNKLRILGVVAILTMMSLLFVGCDTGKNVQPEFDRSGDFISVVVYLHDNDRQVTEAYQNWQKERGVENIDTQPRHGWAGWSTQAPYVCMIHSVKPKRIDDNATLTLGHEMLHCVYGTYHE